MPPTCDPRKVSGTRVHAKCIHVTSLAECKRRFGTLAKTKLVSGTVISARSIKTGQKASWFITADYELSGVPNKRKELNIRSVYAEDAPKETPTHSMDINGINNSTAGHVPRQTHVQRQEEVHAYSTLSTPTPAVSIVGSNATTVNGTTWQTGNDQLPVGGNFAFREWNFLSNTGERLGPESDRGDLTPFFYFLAMFPPKQLTFIVENTNKQLWRVRKPQTSKGEILKFFGILILSTRFEFCTRASLWSNKQTAKYIPAPQFGMTGMSRGRFDTLWRYLRFSYQPEVRPNDMTSESYRWMLVDDFVECFNDYRLSNFSPSDLICVDESMSRWYGMGGYWINQGLPQYIAIDRKPESGCEIQNAACGRSGVMIRLKLVKTAECEEESIQEDQHGLTHGALVLRQLVLPWARTGRVICADSYFASVGTVDELRKIGLRFIGVVKTARKGFPMKVLSEIELSERGEHRGLLHLDAENVPSMLAFVWMDRDRRYFISSCSSLAPGKPNMRNRWRQLSDVGKNDDPERVSFLIPQPEAVEIYYTCCGMIDRHNRCRQDDLMLERKLGTMDWSMRVNLSLFGMCVVDAWLAYKGCTGVRRCYSQAEFYTVLAEELIDNNFDGTKIRTRMTQATESGVMEEGVPCSGLGPHLTPTKKRRRNSNGEVQSARMQGRYKVCRDSKTTLVCSQCRADDPNAPEVWICSTRTGASCFPSHMAAIHRM